MGLCHTKVDSDDQIDQTAAHPDLHAQNNGMKSQNTSALHPTMPTQNVTMDTKDQGTNVGESSAPIPGPSTDIHGSCGGTSVYNTVT